MNGHDASNSILRSFAAVGLLSLLAVTSGCEPKPPANSSLETRDQSPQAKYDRVIETLNDKLGTDPMVGRNGRYTSPSKAGTGTSVIHYTIDAPEKIKEVAPGQSPTATITITQSSSYSFFPTEPEDEEADKEENKSAPSSPLGTREEELEAMGVEILDPSKVDSDLADAFNPKLKPLGTTARTISNETKVVYQLVYEKDRWRLAVPPSVDSMQATNMAMEQALKRQR